MGQEGMGSDSPPTFTDISSLMRPSLPYPHLSALDPLSYARMVNLGGAMHPGMPLSHPAASAMQHVGARFPAGIFPGMPLFFGAGAGAAGPGPAPGALPPGPGGGGLHPNFGFFLPGHSSHGGLPPVSYHHALNLSAPSPTTSAAQSHRSLLEQHGVGRGSVDDSDGLRKSISIDALRQRAREHSGGATASSASRGTPPESLRKASLDSPDSDSNERENGSN